MKKNIVIFASGSGSNAENIINYFSDKNIAEILLVLSNNNDAFVLKRANKFKIKSYVFDKKDLNNNFISNLLLSYSIDYIILAGFLLMIPEKLINQYPNRIINIHPALLPKFGGKGMYGDNVHKKVLEQNEKDSGITIHFVNNKYDEGQIIFQAKCEIVNNETTESLANKIHKLEHEFFPKIIENIILKY